jgi:ligand-binding sensor domain-containing protein
VILTKTPRLPKLVFRIGLILFLLFSTSIHTHSQINKVSPQPIFKQFTVDEGLPSNEVYHIIQDSTGYIWIATANGVSRFDGSTFKNFGLDDGLVESTIHEIYPDYQGRLWFISSSGRLAYLEGNEIKPYQFNHRLNEFIPKSRGTIKKSFYVDSLDNVYLSFKSSGLIVISPEGIVKTDKLKYQDNDIVIGKVDNSLIISSHWPAIKSIDYLFDLGDTTFTIENSRNRSPFHFFTSQIDSKTFIVSSGGRVHKVMNGKDTFSRDYGNEVIWLNNDKSKNLWISPVEGGIHLIRNADFIGSLNDFFLKDFKITSNEIDHEGGLWFSSLANGIFYCPNISINTYNEDAGLKNNRLNRVFANRAGVFVGDDYGVLTQICKDEVKYYNLEFDSLGLLPIRFIGIDSTETNVWIGTNAHTHKLEDGKIKHYINRSFHYGSFPRQIIPAKEGGYWVASSWGIRKFDGKKFTYSSRETNELSGVVYSVFQDTTKTLWLATDNGIWKYEDKIFKYLGEENQLFSHTTNCIAGTIDNKILFATKGVGLLIFDGNTIKRITESDGLASNFINKIFVSTNGIWLATNSGISWLQYDKNGKYNIRNINTSHGLPTNETSDVFVRGNEVYVTTSKGLVVINTDLLSLNNIKPRTIITGFRVSNMSVNFDNQPIKLNYTENILSINFVGLAFKNMSRINYRYRLIGIDTLWIGSTAPTTTFSSLPSGKYLFEVQSQNSDGLWGESTTVNFQIIPPFWQKVWFIILVTGVFSIAIFLVYRLRILSIKKRNDLVNNLNIYKQKSLRQQMNPHFIFNTLNSIQLYILEKDHISSHKYLTKFAKLMRLVLDNSQESSIPLRDEIEALRLYLELESLRLSGKFDYTIDINDEKLLEASIPTLLIQPFVENSIWHGIMLKPDQTGFVKISITDDKESIICTIEDNGVGRVSAQEIRSKQDPERKSLGFKITAQRIDLLNTLYKERFNIQYIDIKDNQDTATGTRVIIRIPKDIKELGAKQ